MENFYENEAINRWQGISYSEVQPPRELTLSSNKELTNFLTTLNFKSVEDLSIITNELEKEKEALKGEVKAGHITQVILDKLLLAQSKYIAAIQFVKTREVVTYQKVLEQSSKGYLVWVKGVMQSIQDRINWII